MHIYLESIPLAPSLLGLAILICFGIYIRVRAIPSDLLRMTL
jgi:hypothetical protein